MDVTSNINLPLLMPSQAQKHVTHNEALVILDVLTQLALVSRTLTAPPVDPIEGDRHVVALAATGAWAGHEQHIAVRCDGGWVFLEPKPGWLAWVVDEQELVVWTGTSWSSVWEMMSALQDLALLGIGTIADAVNPFSAKLNKALWTARSAAEGGDGNLRYTLNKEAAGSVLSLLMQTGFSGRAELGLIGNDDLSLKVSPDGENWTEALRVSDNGQATFSAAGQEVLRTGAQGLAIGGGFSPEWDLHIRRTGSAARCILEAESTANFQIRRYSSDASGPVGSLVKARGTIAAPAGIAQNDVLADHQAVAHDGTAFRNGSSSRTIAVATSPSPSDFATRYEIRIVPPASGTLSEILRLEHGTGLSLYGANPVIDQHRHHRLRSYLVGGLPASAPAGSIVYVANASGGPEPAFSDGTNWRRMSDRSVMS